MEVHHAKFYDMSYIVDASQSAGMPCWRALIFCHIAKYASRTTI